MCRCAVCGLWSPEAGLAMTPDTRWELRADLTGLLLRAAATTDPPFVTTIAEAEAGAGGWSPPPGWRRRNHGGFENIYLGPSLYGDIWGELQRITNFSYSMVTPSQDRYIHTKQ